MEDNVLWGRALVEGLRFANIPEFLLRFRIDRDFYKRRSGTRYGWNHLKTKIKVNDYLNEPFYADLVTGFIGIIKMMPSRLVHSIYDRIRK